MLYPAYPYLAWRTVARIATGPTKAMHHEKQETTLNTLDSPGTDHSGDALSFSLHHAILNQALTATLISHLS